jgi:hypothetical protein
MSASPCQRLRVDATCGAGLLEKTVAPAVVRVLNQAKILCFSRSM